MVELTGITATVFGLAWNCKDITCWVNVHVVVEIIFFLIGTGLSVFNTRTDWIVVLSYQELGFNNPLLPRSIDWLRALFLFASIGTILTTITVLHDGLVLLYFVYKKVMIPQCKRLSDRYAPNETENMRNLQENLIQEDNPNTQQGEEFQKEDVKDPPKPDDTTDPLKPCYRCGCNVGTRNENLGCIGLWFQDVPMLTIAVLYAFSQTTCRVPDNRDVTPFLRDIGISATAATLTSIWKLLRSFYRVYVSIGVRIKERDSCKNCTRIQEKCFPKKGDALYPPGTRTQYCIFPFFVGLVFQLSAIMMAVGVTAGVWISYGIVQLTPNSDNSLGIYRLSINDLKYVRLLNISDILLSNGTLVYLEQVPADELRFDEDIFCLSEFDYRSDDSQIFYNTVQLEVVSSDGHFCVTSNGVTSNGVTSNGFSFCALHYKLLSYASTEPLTGEVERFASQCSVVQFDFNYNGEPVIDSGIDVAQHIDRSNFPLNDEQLVIFYPAPINIYLPVASITTVGIQIVHTFQDFTTAANITCAITFVHDRGHGRINFNYRDIHNYRQTSCSCSFPTLSQNCQQFHDNLFYAFATQDDVVPYTHCSEIPEEMLKPHHDPAMTVGCPCIF
jgi:hypothetical protein